MRVPVPTLDGLRSKLPGQLIGLAREAGEPRSGAMVVLVAVGAMMLLVAAGLAVDGGMLVLNRRNYQKVADTCVMVAAQQIAAGTAVTTGTNCATTNGVSSGVTVNYPPTSGPNAGNGIFVEMIINRSHPTYFMKALGVSSAGVGARSVAGGFRPLDYALMGVRPNTDSVLINGGSTSEVNGNACSRGDFTVNGGNLEVSGYTVANGEFANQYPNGNDPARTLAGAGTDLCLDPLFPAPSWPTWTAPTQTGSVQVGGQSGIACPSGSTPTVDVGNVATVSNRGSQVTIRCNGSYPSPQKVRVFGPVDSLTVDSLNDVTVEVVNGPIKELDLNGDGDIILVPAWYDEIENNVNGGAVRLKAGVYRFNTEYDGSGGGNLENYNADGVTIGVGLHLELTGQGDVNLTGPATGVSNNVLIYHIGSCDAAGDCSADKQLSIGGNNGSRTLHGSVYSPMSMTGCPQDECVLLHGSATNGIYGQVIGSVVSFSGNGTYIEYTGSDFGAARPYLAE